MTHSLLFIAALTLAATPGLTKGQTLYSIGNPTNDQQYMLELINRARANGAAEAARLGLSGGLQEGPPTVGGEPWTIENLVQPLSWNPTLTIAAQGQADILNDADQAFLGVSPHTFGGMTPDERIAAAGYDAAPYSGPTTLSGFFPGQENVAEEISQGTGGYTGANLTAAVLGAHNGLFTDQNTDGRGHRETIMLGFFREVGIGISVGTDNAAQPGQPNGAFDSLYIVQDYGTQTSQTPLITGVVYYDINGNNFYDPGEGIGGVTVEVSGADFHAVTSSSGGYTVPLPGNGTYTITFSGPIPETQQSVTVSNSENVKVDDLSSTPGPGYLANISTRLRVETDDNILIGGFIVTGSASKALLLRAIGPSLPLTDQLANPTLELHDSAGALLESNDDWQSPNEEAIIESTLPPTNDLESAIVRTVSPGAYTAIVRGAGSSTGVGLVEVYDLTVASASTLANISTRGLVQTGDNVMIGGTIVLGQSAQKVIVRAIGPSLPVPGSLADPTLELHDGNGALLASNDNWRDTQEAEIIATSLAPSNDAESAIVQTLAPAAYTAIVGGKNGTTGVALVEVYALTP